MPIDDLTALGQKMREARKKKDLTQQELADLSHVSVKQIAKIEKGEILKTILAMILLSLLFSGCSQKVVIQKEFICYELQDVELSEDVQIRVYRDDLDLFEARNNELKSAISFYKMQNEKYNLECKK